MNDFRKWLTLIVIAIIGYWSINNLSTVGSFFKNILDVVFPFVLGGGLAFILNIPMTFFERKMLKPKKKKTRNKKVVRVFSIIFAIIVILLVLTLISTLILPELINIVNLLINNIPYYVQELTKLAEEHGENLPDINTIVQNINIQEVKNQIIDKIPSILTSSISILSSIISGVKTFFIAIIFAIYILIDKERLQEQTKKIIYAYFSKAKADRIVNIGRVTNSTFKNFFTVQCLEATILGTLCMLGMVILRIPYAVPIGVLIGVTALVPVLGAFVGIIIGAILILSVSPIKAITFVIFVLILQQIEGNLIYPRVVGNSVGLPGMWVLVAVSVGGSIGGVIGMLIGVPIASIIYALLRKDVNKKTDNTLCSGGKNE